MARTTVLLHGVVFTRNKNGYYTAVMSAHRFVWMLAHGEIPEGHHIHHRNHDRSDNQLSNLECISSTDHARHHYHKRTGLRASQLRWCQSDEGRKTLSENMRKLRADAVERTFTCRHCGDSFKTKHPQQRFCSKKCQEERNWKVKPCEICGTDFRYKRHKTRQCRTCSYRCGWALRRKKAGVQAHGG